MPVMSTTIEQERVPSAAPLPRKRSHSFHREGQGRALGLRCQCSALLGGISGMVYYLGFVQPYPMPGNYRNPSARPCPAERGGRLGRQLLGFTWIVLFACYVMAFRFCPSSDNVTHVFAGLPSLLSVSLPPFIASTCCSCTRWARPISSTRSSAPGCSLITASTLSRPFP